MALPVYFVKVLQSVAKPKEGSEEEGRAPVTMLKIYTVFNVDQCDGLPARIISPEPAKPRHAEERDATLDEFIAAMGCDYRDGKGGDRAFYSSSQDFVAMPAFEAFNSRGLLLRDGVFTRDLAHWTGHASRNNREFGKRFGDKAYAAEELVAELTSAFLCAEFSIDGELRHAGYIENWIALLKHESARLLYRRKRGTKGRCGLHARQGNGRTWRAIAA